MKKLTFLIGVIMLTGIVASARTQYSKSELVGGKRLIDIVVSCRSFSPEGDGNGNHQNDNELSQEDRVEKIIQYFADGVYESTEGMHLIRNVRVFKDTKKAALCDILVWNLGAASRVHKGVGVDSGQIQFYTQ